MHNVLAEVRKDSLDLVELHPAPIPRGEHIPAAAHIGVPPGPHGPKHLRVVFSESFAQITFLERVVSILGHEDIVEREVVRSYHCANQQHKSVIVVYNIHLIL